MSERVVVTGMGVVAANAHGLEAFEQALREGRSGIRFHEKLRDLGFGCQVGGVPEVSDELKHQYFSGRDAAGAEQQHGVRRHRGDRLLARRGLRRARARTATRWTGTRAPSSAPGSAASTRWATGSCPGSNEGKVRRLGSTTVEQTMASSVSACVGGFLALGGQVTTNSSACTTGTEAVVDAFHKVRAGRADADDRRRRRRVVALHLGRVRRHARARAPVERQARGRVTPDERDGRRVRALLGRRAADGREPVVGAARRGAPDLRRNPRRPRKLRRPARRRQHDGAEPRGGQAVRAGGARDRRDRTGPDRRDQRAPDRHDGRPARSRRRGSGRSGGGPRSSRGSTPPSRSSGTASARPAASKRWRRCSRSAAGSCTDRSTARTCTRTSRRLPRGFRTRRSSVPPRVLAKASFGFGDVNGCLIFGRWEDGR